MNKFFISKTRRLRSTPFTSRLENYGVGGYTVYNHMLLPTFFKSIEDEYEHLKKHVQLWDVSVQRQIEISGKDSYKLIQTMTCRDLSKSKINKCYYSPFIDKNANIVNDPLLLKIADDKWRICIADSDVLYFAKGIAGSLNLQVDIFETDIATLAVQGPKSGFLMAKIFGKDIKDLKFFNFNYYEFNRNKFMISKSGFSKQGGYEIYIENKDAGLKLYDELIKLGKEFNLKPGCPNAIERIEGALLSFGNDMDNNDNPYECGFDKYVSENETIEYLGKTALKEIKIKGIKKKLMGVLVNTNEINLTKEENIFDKDNKLVGKLRSAAYSPKFKKVVGIAMINKNFCKENNKFTILINNKTINGKVCKLPIT